MLRLFTRLHENIDDVEKRIEKFHYKKKKKEKRIVKGVKGIMESVYTND